MSPEEKLKREEDFHWWITCLPDRIQELKQILPKELSSKLDESIESLDLLEVYIIENYDREFLKSEKGKDILNMLASYLASAIHTLLPNLKFYIELENKKDAYYCLPILKSAKGAPICPYILPITISLRKKGDFVSTIVNKALSKLS